MAENIVGSLFGLTPEMYGEQQRTGALAEGIRLAQLDPAARGAAMTYAGARGLGNAIGGAFGIEDPQLKMISARNTIAQQIDQTNPESIMKGAQMLAQAGDNQGAMALAQYARQAQSEMAQAQQRLAAARASDAATTRERQPLVPEKIQIAERLSKLNSRLDTLNVMEASPERDEELNNISRTIKALEMQIEKPEKLEATTNEFKNASKLALTAGPEGSPEYKARFAIEFERLTATKEGRGNINKIGVAASPAGKAVYLDVNNDLQFIYDKDATGKQIRVPFTGSLVQKAEGEGGGAGGAAGTGTVEVVDPKNPTKTIIVTKAEAVSNRLTPAKAIEGLTPQMRQNLEKSYPQATTSLRGHISKTASFIKDIEALRDSAGLESITGFAAGRAPGFTDAGRAAVALYDKVVAKGGFQVLQDMRDMSKTGGALGNISDRENTQLKAAFAAIDRKQSADDVRAALDNLIIELKGSAVRVKDAYDLTYEYKRANVPQATGGVDPNNPLLRN
jgi:hypothetical protein